MIPLNHICRKCTGRYKLSKTQEKNHSPNGDGQHQTVCQKKKKELETHAVRIYSQDKGMEFGIETGSMLIMKSGKRHVIDGIEIPN